MTLANPAALWLLLLLPLLLFARLRRPPVRRPVSHLPFWTAVAPDAPALSRRPRHDWLLWLQAAFLLALVIALARPHVSIGRRAIALVVDVSMSMGARHDNGTRLDRARATAGALVRNLPGARVHLVAAGAVPVDLGPFDSADALDAALAALEPTAAAADLDAAVDLAKRSDTGPALIHVLTDGPEPPGADDAAPPLAWTTIAQPLDNLAVSVVSARRSPAGSPDVQILVSVRNHGSPSTRAGVALHEGASTDGAIVWRGTIDLPPGGRASIARTVRHPGGVLTASLSGDDGLAADNVRSVVVPPAGPRRVRLDGRSRFVEAALVTHPGVEIAGSGAGPDQTVAGGTPDEIVVCDGCPAPPEASASVLWIPPRPAQPHDAAPLSLTGRIFLDLVGLDGVSVVPVPVDEAVEDDAVVARAGGLPVVVATDTGGRRVVELRLDPDASGLSRGPGFPLLMAAALEWLAPDARNPLNIVAGEPLRWMVPAPAGDATIVGPGGRVLNASRAANVLVARPVAAGVYRVRAGGTERAFVVTPDAGESDLTSPAAPTAAATPAPGGSGETATPYNTDASGAVLMAALLLLAAEWRYRERRA